VPGLALGIDEEFQRKTLLVWFALTPVSLLVGDYYTTRALARARATHERHIIIGANEIAWNWRAASRRTRAPGRSSGSSTFAAPNGCRCRTGNSSSHVQGCGRFVRSHAVNAIYIALPMSNAPRIEVLLREFRDTTASIYFVPDIFSFDLVQARCAEIHGIRCWQSATRPSTHERGQKRAIDILLSSAALLLGWPVLLAIAIAVKLSSPGPVLFKQRRMGCMERRSWSTNSAP